MSREVLSAISHSHDLGSYSTPELRELFHDWLGEIQKETLSFLKDGKRIDPEEVARHLRLEIQSTIFILDKLAKEGRVHPEWKAERDSEPG
jgi:hypothetical protein